MNDIAEQSETERLLALRRELRARGASLEVLPTDLAKYGLQSWTGTFFGLTCVPSPIVKP